MQDAQSSEQLLRADIAFHRALFEAADSKALMFFYGSIETLLERSIEDRMHRAQKQYGGNSVICLRHQDILDAVQAGDPERAMSAMDAHFRTLHD